MSVAVADGVRAGWTCRDCGVRASFAPGFEAPDAPAGWVEERGEWTCLACARAAARLEARLGGGDALERLIDAELRRGVGVNQVAKATGADPLRVRKRRTSLVRAGEIQPPAAKPRRRKDPTAPTRDVLRRLGEADAEAVASETGASHSTAARHLRALARSGKAEAQEKGSGRDAKRRYYRPA